jgi:hypothetical protein
MSEIRDIASTFLRRFPKLLALALNPKPSDFSNLQGGAGVSIRYVIGSLFMNP